MKALPIVAIVIAGLVSACSSSQQQGFRKGGDEQVNLALLDDQLGPGMNPADQPRRVVIGAVHDRTSGRPLLPTVIAADARS